MTATVYDVRDRRKKTHEAALKAAQELRYIQKEGYTLGSVKFLEGAHEGNFEALPFDTYSVSVDYGDWKGVGGGTVTAYPDGTVCWVGSWWWLQ